MDHDRKRLLVGADNLIGLGMILALAAVAFWASENLWVRLPASLVLVFLLFGFLLNIVDENLAWSIFRLSVKASPNAFLAEMRKMSISGVDYWKSDIAPRLPAWYDGLLRRLPRSSSNGVYKELKTFCKPFPGIAAVLQTVNSDIYGLPTWSLAVLPAVRAHEKEFQDGHVWLRYLEFLDRGSQAQTLDDLAETTLRVTELLDRTAGTQVLAGKDSEVIRLLLDGLMDIRGAAQRDAVGRTTFLARASKNMATATSTARDPLLRVLCSQWLTVVSRELDERQESSILVLHIPQPDVETGPEVLVAGVIRNEGRGFADNVRLGLEKAEGYSAVSVEPDHFDLLPPKSEHRFSCRVRLADSSRRELTLHFLMELEVNRVGTSLQFDKKINLLERNDSSGSIDLVNPYETGKPIRESASPIFFGRDDVFRIINRRLAEDRKKQGGKSIILLVGERRLGKTSVLLQLDYQLGPDYIPVFLDAQGFNDDGDAPFLAWIGSHVRRKLRDRDIVVKPPTIQELAPGPTTLFGNFVYDTLIPALHGRHLVLLFDEFEHIEDLIQERRQSTGMLFFLRDLMQHAPQISFIFAGTHRLLEIAAQYASIMFNIAHTLRLEYLSSKDLARLVVEPVAGTLSFDTEGPAAIYDLTGGHPFLTQLLCFELLEQQKEIQKATVSLVDIENAARTLVRTGQSHFDYLFRELDPLSAMLLAGMAAWFESRPAIATDLAGRLVAYNLNPRELDLPKGLQQLTDRGYLIASTGSAEPSFRFRLQIVRIWLNANRPFDQAYRTYVAAKGKELSKGSTGQRN